MYFLYTYLPFGLYAHIWVKIYYTKQESFCLRSAYNSLRYLWSLSLKYKIKENKNKAYKIFYLLPYLHFLVLSNSDLFQKAIFLLRFHRFYCTKCKIYSLHLSHYQLFSYIIFNNFKTKQKYYYLKYLDSYNSYMGLIKASFIILVISDPLYPSVSIAN